MNTEEINKKFAEELEACGGDLSLWKRLKLRQNNSFYGFEIDPEKEKQYGKLKDACRALEKLDKDIRYSEIPFDNSSTGGAVEISLPYVKLTYDKAVINGFARIFAMSDMVSVAVPRLYEPMNEEEAEEFGKAEKRIILVFSIQDIWKTYGKAPFGI